MPDVMSPAQIVTDAYENHQDFSRDLLETALETLEDIRNFNFDVAEVPNVSFAGVSPTSAPFQIPAAPTPPVIDLTQPPMPAEPYIEQPAVPTFADAPEFTATPPAVAFPDRPGALAATPPGDAPTIGDVTIPDAPVLEFPDAPTARTVSLPAVPTVDFPTINFTPPEPNIALPSASFNFSEDEYTSPLLEEVTAKIRALMTGGGFGIPPAIEQALFDRARVREDVTARKAVQEAAEEFSSRGFTQPSGELARRISEVRQKNQDAVNQLSREILLKASDVEIENLRFAVTQGVALENSLISYHSQIAERSLRAAEATVRLAVEMFGVQVTYYNAQVTAYQARVEAFKLEIDTERARIELYRSQLEAARLIGELNAQDVALYTAQVGALVSRVEVFRAQIQGVQARVDLDRARIEAFRTGVEAYAAQVQAKSAEFQAYGEGVKAETAKFGLYQVESEVFANRVRGYAAGVDAQLAPVKMRIDANASLVELYQARLQSFREQVNGIAQRAAAGSQIFDGQARIFGAQVQAASAQSEADGRTFQLQLESAKTQAEVSLRNATSAAENATRAAQLVLQGLQSAAQVAAQLAAGTMSAVNLSAGISGSSSDSRSHSSGVSVGYNIPVAEQASTTGVPNMSYQ